MTLRLPNHKTSWRNLFKSFHKPLSFTFLLRNCWWGILNLILGIRKRRIEYIFTLKKLKDFWHLDLLQRISHNLRGFSSNLFPGCFLKMLTCVLSCSELAFLQKLVTYVEKKGGIQKLFHWLYYLKYNLMYEIIFTVANSHTLSTIQGNAPNNFDGLFKDM